MPVVPPWRRWSAAAEAARRRNLSSTYIEPLGITTAESGDDGFESIKNFLTGFYKEYYTRGGRQRRQDVLDMYPEVASHFAVLVNNNSNEKKGSAPDGSEQQAEAGEEARVVSEVEFWQRYEFRCNVDRILAEWEKNPPGKGGGNNTEGLQGWIDRSVKAFGGVGPSPQSTAPGAAVTTTMSTDAPKKKEEDGRNAQPPDSSADDSLQKLDTSLKNALKDVANWTMQDNAEVKAPNDEKRKNIAAKEDIGSTAAQPSANIWFERLLRTSATETVSVSAPEVKRGLDTSREPREESARESSTLIINSRAQGLRDPRPSGGASGSRGRQSGAMANNNPGTEYRCDDFSFAVPKNNTGRKRSSKFNRSRPKKTTPQDQRAATTKGQQDQSQQEERPRGSNKLTSSKVPRILVNIQTMLARNEMNMSLVIIASLVVGFLAHMILRWSVDAFCASSYANSIGIPSAWWTLSNTAGLVCGNNAPRMAVEVFNNNDNRGSRMKGQGAAYYHQNTEGSFDVGSMLSSWTQNVDFSQFAANGGAENFVPTLKGKKKKKKGRGGIIGFFRRRFGRKSKGLAQQSASQQHPDTVVHQHVHHVVHHVVHESR